MKYSFILTPTKMTKIRIRAFVAIFIQMKKLFATAALLIICGIALVAQTPPPPPGDPSTGGGPVGGGGAPVGSGIAILVALAAGYGAKKVYDYKKKKLAE